MQGRVRGLLAAALVFVVAGQSSRANAAPFSGYYMCTNGQRVSEPAAIPPGMTTDDASRMLNDWKTKTDEYGAHCYFGTSSEMFEKFANYKRASQSTYGGVKIVDFQPRWRSLVRSAPKDAETAESKPAKTESTAAANPGASTARTAADLAAERAEAKARREAEFQAKLAAHEKSVADYKRKLSEREAEIARQQAELAANAEAAAAKKAAYERELAEANRRQQEYFAAQRRHALCLSGDQAACADIAANKPVEEQLAENDKPETSDDDARQCVASPVVSQGSSKGQLQAVVINGCRKAVDVRICLLRTGGWNCGVIWGLAPQAKWAHTSFETQGEIFWDARLAGSNKKLAQPSGS